MIVKVKKIPVRHNGTRYLANHKFEISQEDYKKIQKFVDVIKEETPVDPPQDNTNKGQDPNSPQAPKKIEDMTVPELKDFAEEMEIDLGDATKKDDIIQRIQKAMEA
ncbi:Rho termination factor N-terminal domain-containing protein [Paenibacillus glucanolyticus]|uniref:Rho termination factor N-terminal domain-containing protein n=1 Tax=Paenibacillus glucanolyticus TaxID=59843 RepID=UPI0030C96E96